MFKYTSTYDDWNGVKRTEDFYFSLTEAELTELEVATEGGFSAYVKKISNAKDSKETATAFKKMILLSYGEKSADGRYFLKSDEISQKFTGSPVYSEMYMRLARDAKFALKFMNGILPKSMQKNETEIYKATKELEHEIEAESKAISEDIGVVSDSSESERVIDVPSEVVEN